MNKLNIGVMLEDGVKMPTKAHDEDAGFDLYAPERIAIHMGSSRIVDTGVHFQIPKGYTGFIKSKSGLNHNEDIVCEGVVDSGYTGTVQVKFYNHGGRNVYIEKGQKMTQIVFLPIPDVELAKKDSFEDTARGDNGFGSTGKF